MRRATGLQTAFRSGWEPWTGDRDKRRHVWRARNPLRFPIYRFGRGTVPATCMKMLGASYEPLIPISGNAYTAYSGRISADCGGVERRSRPDLDSQRVAQPKSLETG